MRVIHAQASAGTTGRTLTAQLKLLRPSTADLVDAAFLAAACLLALAGFVTGFDGPRFLLVAAVGVAVGIGAGHVAVTYRWSWAAAALMAGVAYFLLGGPLAVGAETLAGFRPTASSLTTLAVLLVTGWMEFLTTLPPVDGAGDYLALPLVLALLAGAIGHCVARRTRIPWPALVVPLLLFGLVTALGTLDAPLQVVQGLGLGAVCVGWLAVRFPRRRRVLGSGRPGRTQLVLGAGMLAAALLGGAAVAPVLPGVAAERTVLRTELEPPIDVRAYPSPLVGFRTFSGRDLKLYWDTPLLQVDGVQPGTLLRLAVLDRWSSATWSGLGEGGVDGSGFDRLGARVPNPPLTGVTTTSVRVLDGYAGNQSLNAWVPSLGRVAAVGFEGETAQRHRDNYRFNLATDQAFVPDRLQAGDVLLIDSAPLTGYASVAGYPAPGDGERQDDASSAFLASTTQRLAAGDAEQWAQLAFIAKALQQGAWSDGTRAGEEQYLPGHGQYRLNQFVTAPQFVGSDEQYAATFALMASRLGYPARVVFGAEVPAGGEVRGKNVQAWVELSVDGLGWVTVPASVFTPDRSKKPEQNQQQNNDQESVQNVPPPNPVPPPGTYDEMNDTDPASARAELPPGEEFWRALWAVLRWVGPPLALLALLAGSVLALKAVRSHGRRTRGAASTRIAGGFDEVLDAARDVGREVPPRLTRLEASAAVGRDDVDRLAREANAAVFGAGEIGAERVDGYWREVLAARTAMIRELPWWRRALARLSLASLVTRRRG
ncbi:transglutaminase-like domain-containing protein [Micropruina sonneratiae]|uniref:transglutaminase-like domain-containing protein n=1 Tax=Micropruina sonneratiae TaxID=2986940 RepID=UPI002225CEE8|nr:transglutaminase-like domain-containing protein [Micropruina sp. KQZ13P-5]MCW3158455.1 transglutaminase-like domain-containing protein [Micropruina sp. KQZ13P-5]